MSGDRVVRQLRRSPHLMGVPAVLAIVVGLMMTYRLGLPPERRQHSVGIATVAAMVDTPTSRVVDLSSHFRPDITSLAARASLLASLVAVSPIKDDVAARAGVQTRHLIGLPPVQPGPESRRPRPVSGATVDVADRDARVLRPSVPFQAAGDSPIIEIEAQAPTAAGAVRLADAAVAALTAHLSALGTSQRVPSFRRLVIRPLAPATATVQRRGPSLRVAVLAALAVFGAGCAGMARAATRYGRPRTALVADPGGQTVCREAAPRERWPATTSS